MEHIHIFSGRSVGKRLPDTARHITGVRLWNVLQKRYLQHYKTLGTKNLESSSVIVEAANFTVHVLPRRPSPEMISTTLGKAGWALS